LKGKHLSRFKDYYYFRRAVPKDLRAWFTGKEIKRSLKTKSFIACKTLAHQWDAQLESVFIKIRATVFKPEEVKAIIAKTPLFAEMVEPPIRTDFFMPIPAREPQREAQKIDIGILIMQYIHEYKVSERWTEKSKQEAESIFRLFKEIIGDLPLPAIDHQKLLSVREALLRLPANIRRKAMFRDKSVAEILKMKDVKPMSGARVNKILSRINSFFKWCHTHKYVSEAVSTGLTIPKKRQDHEDRAVYSDEDIEKMLASPFFTSIADNRPDRFWVPLIGLLSGMRLNEICQLYLDDVKEVDGIWCFDVNTEKDKILKNLSSKRLVPVHPVLLEIGFLSYVEKVRAEGKARLWMGLNPRRDGYGHSFSNFWQRYNRRFITTDPKKVFHSFRHLVGNTLKQKGVSDTVISEILGHSVQSITLGRYGKKYQPGVLLEALRQISPKMDLERLKRVAEGVLTLPLG
jgi:integrase